MGKHLVLIGGGHAHVVTIFAIDEYIRRGHAVSVIGPAPHHYYSGMGPGMLGGTYTPEQIRFDIQSVVERQGGNFIVGKAVQLDPHQRRVTLNSGAEISYDIVSCNCGSTIRNSLTGELSCPTLSVKPIENLLAGRKFIRQEGKQRQLRIAVIGGGPSAAELAGNIIQFCSVEGLPQPDLNVFCRGAFMSRYTPQVRNACYSFLTSKGVKIHENEAVVLAQGSTITTSSDNNHTVDLVFSAQGVQPSELFINSGLATGPDGGLKVNTYLQAVDHPEIFGGGDCIFFEDQPLDKVGVYAVRQNPVLQHNLLAALSGEELQPFSPGGGYLLIFNLGSGYGVLKKGPLFWRGRLAFRIKDYIDRKFMNEFN